MKLKKIHAFINISRPLNFTITFFSVMVGSILCISGEYSSLKILGASLSGGLTASAGNVINDIFDIEIDKISHPMRPLPVNKITPGEAAKYYSILVVFSLIISYLINIDAFIIVTGSSALLFLYSYKLKKFALTGNIVVAFMTGLAFIYGGVAVNNVSFAIIPAVFAFLINLIREIVKDIEDLEGDLKAGLSTFPHIYGIKAAKKIILIVSIILIIATFYPFVIRIYRIEYFIMVMAIVNPLIIYTLKSLYKDDSRKNLNKLSFILKLDMIFGLIAIFLGK